MRLSRAGRLWATVDAVCNGNNAEGRKDAFPVSDDLSHAWFKSTPAQHIKGGNMIREDNLDKFTDEELIQMVKESMDELGIAYEEGPGGWGNFLPLDPEKDMQPPGA